MSIKSNINSYKIFLKQLIYKGNVTHVSVLHFDFKLCINTILFNRFMKFKNFKDRFTN